jgi:hypothetical protein
VPSHFQPKINEKQINIPLLQEISLSHVCLRPFSISKNSTQTMTKIVKDLHSDTCWGGGGVSRRSCGNHPKWLSHRRAESFITSKTIEPSRGRELRLERMKIKPNYSPNRRRPHQTFTDIVLRQPPNLHMFCRGTESRPKATTEDERSRLRGEGVNDAGHVESREGDYTWRSPIGALRRWLQTVIVCNAPKTVYSRNVVVD